MNVNAVRDVRGIENAAASVMVAERETVELGEAREETVLQKANQLVVVFSVSFEDANEELGFFGHHFWITEHGAGGERRFHDGAKVNQKMHFEAIIEGWCEEKRFEGRHINAANARNARRECVQETIRRDGHDKKWVSCRDFECRSGGDHILTVLGQIFGRSDNFFTF